MKLTSLSTTRFKVLGGLALALLGAARVPGYVYTVTPPSVWVPGNVAYQIKMATTPTLTDGTNYATSVQAAMSSWNAVLGVVQFNPTIVAAGSTTRGNSINEIAFSATVEGAAWGTGVLAVTLASSYPSIHERAEADILFNSGRTWDSYRGNLNSTQDIRRVALHELGHSLGLDHPDSAGQSIPAVMNSTASNTDALTADDIAGAQSLYSSPGATTAPPNDNFANATAITLSGNAATLNGSTIYATKETGEPTHVTGATGAASAWWKWTAPSAGTLTVNLDGSRFDTVMAVYTGTAVNALTKITSNDDYVPGTSSFSYVTFTAVAGTTYYIAVDGYEADQTGLVTMAVAFSAGTPTAPAFTTQPTSTSGFAGGSAQFTIAATGNPTPTYQWQRLATGTGTWTSLSNGGSYSGVTTTTLTVTAITSGMSGDQFRCIATNSVTSTTSNAAALTVNTTVDVGRLINLSIRSNAGTGSQTLQMGFVIGGNGTTGNKPILLRGIGPTLGSFGVTGVLADPLLELYQQPGPTLLQTNDDWGGDATITSVGNAVGAFALTPATSKDAAIYTTRAGGVYAVKIVGTGGTTGVALAELYDATPSGTFTATTPRLINVSASTVAGTSDSALIAGFVVGGSTSCTVLIRGIGPTLGSFGVSGVLADPVLTLFRRVNGVDSQVDTNDDWSTAANAATVVSTSTQVGAFALASGTKDAVLLVTLQPGVYSAQVSGKNNTTGVALVEIYEVP